MTLVPRGTPLRPGLVTIVLPAKDEARTIGPTLRKLPRDTIHAMGFQLETLVLDGRSRDGTRDVVYEHGDATVIFDREPGKGNAFIHARPHMRGDYVVMLDADGTYAPDAIVRLLGLLARDEADVVMGERMLLPGSMSALHVVGNSMLSLLAQTLYLRRCPDVCTGLWGFRGDALARLPLRSARFELEADIFSTAARQRLRIARVPVDYLPRTGSSKLNTMDALRIAGWLMRCRVAPMEMPSRQAARTNRTPAAHTSKTDT